MGCGAHSSAPLSISVDALLTTDIALLEEERSEESDSEGYDDTQVCRRPGPVLTSDGAQKVSLPVEPVGGGVHHQSPAKEGGDGKDGESGDVPGTVSSLGSIEVGGVIVLPAKQNVGYEHACPGGHGYAERNQEALEGADECGGEEGYIDYSDYGQHGGDGRCECPRELDAEGEQGQTIGVVVHDGPGYQPQHRNDGEWNQIPSRQYAGHGSDGVVAHVFGQAFVGDG